MRGLFFSLFFLIFYVHSIRAEETDFQTEFEDLMMDDLDVEFALSIEDLSPYEIVIVPGFLSGVFDWLGTFCRPDCLDREADFELQRKLFDEHGISYSTVALESEASVEENKQSVREHIEATDKPVILFSHSKGGLDSLAALLGWPELQEKVAAWISLQSPFYGADLADEVVNSKYGKRIVNPVLKFFEGDFEAIESLTVETRATYMEEHEARVERLLEKIPSFQICSTIEGYPDDVSLPFSFTSNIYKGFDKINDGIVPLEGCFLEGAEHLLLEGLDHSHLNRGKDKAGFSNRRFTQAILLLVIDRLSESEDLAIEPS